MFRNLRSKTKKVLVKAGALMETVTETVEDIIDEIEGPDFD